MNESVRKLADWVEDSRRIVFFGGAGVSTESGIPDFRSVDGLYNQKYAWPPETILSHQFFMQKTGEFYRFYRDKMLYPGAQPNACHRKLAEYIEEHYDKAVRRTASRLGECVGVSESTVVRFAVELGYDGYDCNETLDFEDSLCVHIGFDEDGKINYMRPVIMD